MDLDKIAKTKKDEFYTISQHFGIVYLVAFGSVITGKTNQESDLDLAVYLDKILSSEDFFNLFNQLQDHFAGYNIHLNILNQTDILFRHKIVIEGKLLFGDPNQFLQYKLLSHKIYLDDMPKITRFYDKTLFNNQQSLKRGIYD